MDAISHQLLEYDRIKQIVSVYSSFSKSREMILALQPCTDYEQVKSELALCKEARYLLDTDPAFNMDSLKDISDLSRQASRGKIFEPAQLLEVSNSIRIVQQVIDSISCRGKEIPLLQSLASRLMQPGDLEIEITKTISQGGEIYSSSSARLAQIRNQLKTLREQILRDLDKIIKNDRSHGLLQDPIITQREGRYVIPVKYEYKKDIKGIVHDVSNSGATVFIEPIATLDTGNEIKQLELEEKREIERILSNLSNIVGSYCDEIINDMHILAIIDLQMAKAKFAQDYHAVEPEIHDIGHCKKIKLVAARHPFLKNKAVPLNIELGAGYRVLVITGPNTGGKTVALKTIGLLCLMAQSGLPITADSASELSIFDEIFADIGDEQSIEQTLSSFSWHMSNISRIIQQSTACSLVLMDELGTSTDPVEGSALAVAVLEYFFENETITVATSHFNELKALAHVTPGIKNASFEFDPVTMIPTYNLIIGIPGGSNALVTAARFGIPPAIINKSRQRLSGLNQQVELLIGSLADERFQLKQLISDTQKEKTSAEQLKAELAIQLDSIRQQKDRLINDERDKIAREIHLLHQQIKDTSTQLKADRSHQAVNAARRALDDVTQRLRGLKPGRELHSDTDKLDSSLKAGDWVWLSEIGMEARIASINQASRQLVAEAGSMRFKLGLEGVIPLQPKAPEKSRITTKAISVPSASAIPIELDLRGKRADEAQILLDAYLNETVMANCDRVYIIHGHGTGVLRQIVREYIADHPVVKSFRAGKPEEGGDGVTVITLK